MPNWSFLAKFGLDVGFSHGLECRSMCAASSFGLGSKDPVSGLHDNDASRSEKDFAYPASLKSNNVTCSGLLSRPVLLT